MDAHDLTAWALRQRPTGTRAVGEHGIVRVLIALCQYASADLIAWPSVASLADATGMDGRTVRAALEALDACNLIEAAEPTRAGRTTRWRILATSRDTPRGCERAERADSPDLAGDLAGNLAGDLAGNLAGYPATKGREENRREETRASAPRPLICPKHPEGNASKPCRTCGDVRRARAAVPTVSAPFTVQPGAGHPGVPHKRVPDGTCALCDARPEVVAADLLREGVA